MEIVQELKKFNYLLGPQLQAVTGSSESIEALIESLKKITGNFLNLEQSLFDKNNYKQIKIKVKDYRIQAREIQEKTIKLIEAIFIDLRSSEQAFELLQKFQNLRTFEYI